MFSKLFWGGLVVLIGIGIILNSVLDMDIPIFRVLFALFLIYWGVKLLIDIRGNNSKQEAGVVVFDNAEYEATSLGQKDFSAVFGSQVIDLRHVSFPPSEKIEVNAVFGSSKIYLPKELNVQVQQNAVFGSVEEHRLPTISDTSPNLKIEANAVFGQVEIIQ